MNKTLFLTLVAAVATASPSVAQDSTLIRLVSQHRYTMEPSGTGLAGSGWDKLQASITKSQFVLVGEDHGTAQIPQFVQAVARVQQPAAFVAEIDQYQAEELTRLTAQAGFPTAYFKANPGSLSFYSWGEEFELARQLRAQKAQLIGIEQVGVFTIGHFYAQLAGQVKSKAVKAYLQRHAALYQARDLVTTRTGGEGYSMFVQRQLTVDSLVALVQPESSGVRQMVQNYVASYRIYQGQIAGTSGHQERINLMKRNLLQSLKPYQTAAGQPLPKLLFKFGASHMARVLSPWSGITDVGNLVQNLADIQDARSLHLLVMGKQGTHAGGFNPDDSSKNAAAYDLATEPFLKPFTDLTTGVAWQVFDLRPARRALLSDKLHLANQTLAGIILGYDYVVIIPQTTAGRS